MKISNLGCGSLVALLVTNGKSAHEAGGLDSQDLF